ncbi:MAG: MerR family transcriptional regulator [Planctomycetota bacterium]|jgi:MerR family transcriptional regulator/heat shock protein HspR
MDTRDTDTAEPVISIGTLSEKVGLSVSAVRKYEKEGLIIPHRLPSGHRLFSFEDVHRVRNIQNLIQEIGLNIEGIRRLQALLPCWDLLPCSGKTRDKCPAFQNNTKPCWTIKGLDCAPQGNECRKCKVYRFGSLCTEDIKQILHEPADLRSTNTALRELIEKKKQSKKEDD